MCCRSFRNKLFSFSLTLAISLSAVSYAKYLFSNSKEYNNSLEQVVFLDKKNGIGTSGGCSGKKGVKEYSYSATPVVSKTGNVPFRILSKPHAEYTDIARQNLTTGTVRVRVTFLASGQTANIHPLTQLPDGLTEQATIAAAKIRFQPEIRKTRSVSVTKIIEYSFNIY